LSEECWYRASPVFGHGDLADKGLCSQATVASLHVDVLLIGIEEGLLFSRDVLMHTYFGAVLIGTDGKEVLRGHSVVIGMRARVFTLITMPMGIVVMFRLPPSSKISIQKEISLGVRFTRKPTVQAIMVPKAWESSS